MSTSSTELTQAKAVLAGIEKAIKACGTNHPGIKADLEAVLPDAKSLVTELTPAPPPPVTLTLSNLKATPPEGTVFDVTVDCSSDIVNVTIYDSVTGAKAASDCTPVKGVASWPALAGLAPGVHQLNVQGWTKPAGEGGPSTPVLSVTVTVPTPTPPSPPSSIVPTPAALAGLDLTVTLQEDFDAATVDTALWNVCDTSTGDDPINSVNLSPSNVTLEDGALVIQLSDAGTGGAITSCDSSGKQWSGHPFGRNKIIEFRIWIPGPEGSVLCYNWGAGWVAGPQWPNNYEFDIAEAGDGFCRPCFIFGPVNDPEVNDVYPTNPGITANEWHTFTCDYTNEDVNYYYDGEPLVSHPTNGIGADMGVVMNVGNGNDNNDVVIGPEGAWKFDYCYIWERN